MSPPVLLVSQRVAVEAAIGERRDALDQRWASLLEAAGFLLVPVPNHAAGVEALAEATGAVGVVLTGGNDIAALGGDVPERDSAEAALLAWGRRNHRPVLGVCRGMQFLLSTFGAVQGPVHGHVAVRHPLTLPDRAEGFEVNSYHAFGAMTLPSSLIAAATAADGVVEAFYHADEPIAGVMWHPEREAPYRQSDLNLLRRFFADGLFRIQP